jgi:hypothetical protein
LIWIPWINRSCNISEEVVDECEDERREENMKRQKHERYMEAMMEDAEEGVQDQDMEVADDGGEGSGYLSEDVPGKHIKTKKRYLKHNRRGRDIPTYFVQEDQGDEILGQDINDVHRESSRSRTPE